MCCFCCTNSSSGRWGKVIVYEINECKIVERENWVFHSIRITSPPEWFWCSCSLFCIYSLRVSFSSYSFCSFMVVYLCVSPFALRLYVKILWIQIGPMDVTAVYDMRYQVLHTINTSPRFRAQSYCVHRQILFLSFKRLSSLSFQ